MNKSTLIPMGLAATIIIFAVGLAYSASAKITRLEMDALYNKTEIITQNKNMDRIINQLHILGKEVARNNVLLEEIKRKVK